MAAAAAGSWTSAPDRVLHQIDGSELVPKKEGKIRFRRSIFNAWGSCCAYCGKAADTLDHVLPVVRGGLTVRHNLIPACRPCNLAKGHQDVLDWFRLHAGWNADRELRILQWINPVAPVDLD